MITVSRRRLFGLGTAFLAAPSIVRVGNLMPISVLREPLEWVDDTDRAWVQRPIDLGRIRDLLLPGLREIFEGKYARYDELWSNVLAGASRSS